MVPKSLPTSMKDFVDVPDPIKVVKLIALSSNEATFSWEEPDSNNLVISGYQFTTKVVNPITLEHDFHSFFQDSETKVTLERLTPDRWYTVEIKAQNEYGLARESNPRF